LPTRYERSVSDVKRGRETEPSFFNGVEKPYVVGIGQGCVQPVLIYVDGCLVQLRRGALVDSCGSCCEGGVASCGCPPKGLRNVRA
jgi:hypothetical protein